MAAKKHKFNAMPMNPNASYGRSLLDMLGSRFPGMGNLHVVCPTGDAQKAFYQQLVDVVQTDANGQARFWTSLEDAYGAALTSDDDVILLSSNSTHTLSSGMLSVSKNRIHFYGMGGEGRLVQQAAKIEVTGSTATVNAAVLKVTGVRNTFHNIKFINSGTHATALNVVIAAGEGTVYENCSFIFGVNDNLDLTTSSELLCGEDSGMFINCSFGTDVLLTSAARQVVSLAAVSGGNADGAKSNRFINCEHVLMTSDAAAVHIRLAAISGAKFLNEWVEPRFLGVISSGGGGIAVTNAIASASSFVDGSLHFVRPTTNGCTNGCATTTDHVTISGAPVFTSNAWEGGTPA